jgi:hypothetical protein
VGGETPRSEAAKKLTEVRPSGLTVGVGSSDPTAAVPHLALPAEGTTPVNRRGAEEQRMQRSKRFGDCCGGATWRGLVHLDAEEAETRRDRGGWKRPAWGFIAKQRRSKAAERVCV